MGWKPCGDPTPRLKDLRKPSEQNSCVGPCTPTITYEDLDIPNAVIIGLKIPFDGGPQGCFQRCVIRKAKEGLPRAAAGAVIGAGVKWCLKKAGMGPLAPVVTVVGVGRGGITIKKALGECNMECYE